MGDNKEMQFASARRFGSGAVARTSDRCLRGPGFGAGPQFERTKGKVLGLVLARFKPVVYDTSSLELTYQSAEERILSVAPLFEFHE